MHALDPIRLGFRVSVWTGAIGVAAQIAVCAQAADIPTPGETMFVQRLQPLFKERCLPCHGDDPAKIKGDLDLRTLAGLQQGGESGRPSIVPGRPEESPLYLAVTRQFEEDWTAMPPKENDRLTDEQINWFKQWITEGAPWPDTARLQQLTKSARGDSWEDPNQKGVKIPTSGGLSEDWTHRRYQPENLWGYQPLRKPPVPKTSTTASAPGNPMDAFIEARLPQGLTPAPPADRRTLIRRVTFDLIGLPPTPEEITAYLNDPASEDEAYGKVVERLLASPHYGERWARHWLDVVRYADSSGFANDYMRGNAWRYRDYVVRAFNADKPYDQFVREQLAGDELYDQAEPAAQDPELLVAAGFLRMGPWELTGMEVAKIARQRFLDDITQSVGETFLGHALQCARCHDHKFDPVPTRDYYALQAALATTQMAERRAPFLKKENQTGFEERRYLAQRRAEHLAVLERLDAKSLAAAQDWFREKQIDPTPWNQAVTEAREREDNGRERSDVFNAVRRQMMKQGVPEDQFPPKLYGFTPEDYGMERVARKGLERLRWEEERYEPFALTVYAGRTPSLKNVNVPLRRPADPLSEGELERVAILAGGDPFSPTAEVRPGTLSVVDRYTAELQDGFPKIEIPESMAGRRLALATWLTHPRHPLTARVMVNRIWQWHFGQAIAGNPNNFGATGKKPTHPELLDWLAATLIEHGWSVKSMHRLIVTSAAYRRSTSHPDPATVAALDPHGTSYALFHPRRLTAEELRDAMLAISGELNLALGGIPARPEMNLEAALQPRMVMGTFAEAWQPNPLPAQRHRRSLYALKIRGLTDPFFEVFNQPTPDLSCEAREASTVTPQVFSLWNSQSTLDRAVAMAARLIRETATPEEALDHAFRLIFGRAPRNDERRQMLDHWKAMTARHRKLVLESPRYPSEVTREVVEENTGEKFTFVERLGVSADFVPDLHLADVDPTTRGLAEVCLVLFNANEFVYVY